MLKPNPKVIVFLPCYKRSEYTDKCIESLRKVKNFGNELFFYLVDDGSNDGTDELLKNCGLKGIVVVQENCGLRNTQIDFFEYCKNTDFDLLVKADNDCLFPENWIESAIELFTKTNVDILSPNVKPSNAAFAHGKDDTEGLGYRPSEILGGLWMLRRELIQNMYFEKHDTQGLVGAIPILRQIVTEKSPKLGWMADVIVEDIGHWSGKHPLHIKSAEHEFYSKEVGRGIAWKSGVAVNVKSRNTLEENRDDF